ncbi:uncharacterized protein (DUF1501 family) [Streptacidiphilus sp. MAP12-16]|uniref:DUF1501 domain-containing protein n=1 Tax=Streptacidiphilus sp. MAP12-16 TaxID=3156300 RepID=UPI003515D37E
MMHPALRSRFLRASKVTGTSASAAPPSARSVRRLLGQVSERPWASPEKVLVVVTLYGGNDGLSTVVPYDDGAYQDARPGLAYQVGEILDLGPGPGAGLGLNPAMTGLHALWRTGRLAIVQGVGYPNPSRSHFTSMDIWQTAAAAEPLYTGWLGRWLDLQEPADQDPLRAVSIGSVLPPMLAGERASGAAVPLGAMPLPGRLRAKDVARLGRPDAGDPVVESAVAASLCDFLTVRDTFDPVVRHWQQSTHGRRPDGGSLATQLDFVAACVQAGVSTRVYAVSLAGFDGHADAKPTQSSLLAEVDTAVSRFLGRLDGAATTPTVLIYSEFGRRVAANDSHGTDHGTAGPVLVAGPAVRGGCYGERPNLRDLHDGDLKFTTDFRSVYSALLDSVLDTEPARVLGSQFPRLALLCPRTTVPAHGGGSDQGDQHRRAREAALPGDG